MWDCNVRISPRDVLECIFYFNFFIPTFGFDAWE